MKSSGKEVPMRQTSEELKVLLTDLKKWSFLKAQRDNQIYSDNPILRKIGSIDRSEDYTDDCSLLFKFETIPILVKSPGSEQLSVLQFSFIVTVANNESNGLYDSEYHSYNLPLWNRNFYHECFVRGNFPEDIDVIECRGSKCRKSLYDDNIWCESCNGDFTCNNIGVFLKRFVTIDEIPDTSILYIEKTETVIDLSNKKDLVIVKNCVDNILAEEIALSQIVIDFERKIFDLQQKRTVALDQWKTFVDAFPKVDIQKISDNINAKINGIEKDDADRKLAEKDAELKRKEMEMIHGLETLRQARQQIELLRSAK